jgi:PIN domain nuclease of toxin-antitoxin system
MSLILDTCAVLWISEDAPLAAAAVSAIDEAQDTGEPLLLSPITAWEIGLLVSRGRLALPTQPQAWLDRILNAPNLKMLDLGANVLLASSFLPGKPPRDPSDKIIIATARECDLTIVTRDRQILSYGAAGHVRTIAC